MPGTKSAAQQITPLGIQNQGHRSCCVAQKAKLCWRSWEPSSVEGEVNSTSGAPVSGSTREMPELLLQLLNLFIPQPCSWWSLLGAVGGGRRKCIQFLNNNKTKFLRYDGNSVFLALPRKSQAILHLPTENVHVCTHLHLQVYIPARGKQLGTSHSRVLCDCLASSTNEATAFIWPLGICELLYLVLSQSAFIGEYSLQNIVWLAPFKGGIPELTLLDKVMQMFCQHTELMSAFGHWTRLFLL